jgi:hypothetical protein
MKSLILCIPLSTDIVSKMMLFSLYEQLHHILYTFLNLHVDFANVAPCY